MCRMAILFDQETALILLGHLNQEDGAGIYSASKQVLVKHKILSASDFAPMISDDVLPVMVHARAASIGAICTNNCQPFKIDRTILAHNGTISKSEFELPSIKINDPKCLCMLLRHIRKSDSCLLAETLAGSSIEEADKKLERFSKASNFFFYSEVEKKFLVKGTFQALFKSPGVVRAVVAGIHFQRIGIPLQGTLILSNDGTILEKDVQKTKVENDEVLSWNQKSALQQCSLFG